jgi:hypothetical protein
MLGMFIRQVDNAIRLTIRRSVFAPTLRKVFRKTPIYRTIRIGQDDGWDNAAHWILSSEGIKDLDNHQVHDTLRNSINTDISTELLLTTVRKELLFGDEHLLDKSSI